MAKLSYKNSLFRTASLRFSSCSHTPPQHSWKNLETNELQDEFPVKWVPAKLRTVVRKHCAEHASMDYAMLRNLTGEDEQDSDSGKDERIDEDADAQFGVYMLILESEESEQKCQIYAKV